MHEDKPLIESRFGNRLAVVVGIDAYTGGIPPLRNAARDARAVADLLRKRHGYEDSIQCFDDEANLARLRCLFERELPERVQHDDQVVIYFAGHGLAEPDER